MTHRTVANAPEKDNGSIEGINHDVTEGDIISILGNQENEIIVEPQDKLTTQDSEKIDQQLENELQTLNNAAVQDTTKHDASNFRKFALIRVLNKITTKSEELKISKDKINKVGKLIITMAYCWQSPSSLETENKSYIEVFEQSAQNDQSKIFGGWLFSSSPAVSTIQHPIYDIHLLSCIDK